MGPESRLPAQKLAETQALAQQFSFPPAFQETVRFHFDPIPDLPVNSKLLGFIGLVTDSQNLQTCQPPPQVHLKTLGAATNAGGRLNAQTQPHFCTSSLQKTLSLLLVFPKPCHINLCSLVPPYNQLQNFFCNTSQGRLQECQGYGQSRPDRTLDQLRQFSGSLNATCVGPESRLPTQKLAETQALGIKQNIGS